MEELSIKIKIAEREYPMKVKRDEEEKVRAAGKLINEKLRLYKEQFGIDDKQDLLAMVAFDSVVQKQTSEEDHREIDQTLIDKVSHLNQMVSQAIL
jgi:cell division protein ZapA